MARTTLILLVVALFGGGVWFAFAPPPAVETGPVSSGERPEEVNPTPGSMSSPEPGLQPEGEGGGVSRVQVETPELVEEHQVQPSLKEGEGIRIEAVRASDGSPVGGALVFAIDTSKVDNNALERAMVMSRDISGVMETFGTRYRTRSDGSVVIPTAAETLVLSGQTKDLFGFLVLASPDAEDRIQLELTEDRSIQAHVKRADGQPVAKAPIVLRVHSGGETRDLLQAMTDSRGNATLRRLAILETMPFQGTTVVAIGVPLLEPVEVEVDLSAPPEDTVEFLMPATGRLEVEVLAREGGRVEDALPVALKILREGEAAPTRMLMSGDAGSVTEAGVAIFPQVGLGIRLAVYAFDSSDQTTWIGEVEGPRRPGETAQLTLEPDLAAPALVFQVVDVDGEAVADARLEAKLIDKSDTTENHNSSRVSTDAEGRARVTLDPTKRSFDGHRTLQLTRKSTPESVTELTVRVELANILRSGDNDLGTLRMEPPPGIISGTVFGSDGNPVAGAALSIQYKTFYGERETDFYWQGHSGTNTTSAADGSFALTGFIDEEQLRLIANADSWQQSHLDFQLGAAGVVVQMDRAATVIGQVLVDRGVDPTQLDVRAEPVGHDGKGGVARPDSRGRFRLASLAPGGYRFHVEPKSGSEVLYLIEDVTIGSALPTDRRIAEIDLRGKLHALNISVVDQSGEPVREVYIRERNKSGQSWYAWRGETTIVTVKPELDLEVSAPGYEAVKLDGAVGDQEVQLRGGRDVELVLENPQAVPRGYAIHVQLVEADLAPSNGHWGSFDPSGRSHCKIGGPGAYRVRYYVSANGSSFRMGFGDPATIQAPDSPGRPSVTVPLDAEALQKAIDQLP